MVAPARNPGKARFQAPRATGIVRSLAIVLVLLASSVPAQAQDGCRESGMNVQCNAFGTIKTANQADVRGEAVSMTITTTLHRSYMEEGARYILFSVRHAPEFESSPVSLSLQGFSTPSGDVVVDKVDQPTDNEINIWVHVIDLPVGTPIALDVLVGADQRGAFRLETLVMPFDRGYESVSDSAGNEISLYTFSMLGVNKETSGGGGGGTLVSTPGFAMAPAIAALLGVALLVLRRRSS